MLYNLYHTASTIKTVRMIIIPMHTSISHPLVTDKSNNFFLELYQSILTPLYTLEIPVGPLNSYPHDCPSRSAQYHHKGCERWTGN